MSPALSGRWISGRAEDFPVTTISTRDSVDHLIAEQARIFLDRQPRSTELIARAQRFAATLRPECKAIAAFFTPRAEQNVSRA